VNAIAVPFNNIMYVQGCESFCRCSRGILCHLFRLKTCDESGSCSKDIQGQLRMSLKSKGDVYSEPAPR